MYIFIIRRHIYKKRNEMSVCVEARESRSQRQSLSPSLSASFVARVALSTGAIMHVKSENCAKRCEKLRENKLSSRCPFSLPQPLPLTGPSLTNFFFFFRYFFSPPSFSLSPLQNRIFRYTREFCRFVIAVFNSATVFFFFFFFCVTFDPIVQFCH